MNKIDVVCQGGVEVSAIIGERLLVSIKVVGILDSCNYKVMSNIPPHGPLLNIGSYT